MLCAEIGKLSASKGNVEEIVIEEPLNKPEKVVKALGEELKQYDREVVAIIHMQNDCRPINMTIASIGSVNNALASPRELLKAAILSNIRKDFAKNFEERVKNELAELSMKGAKFSIGFETLNEETCDETGFDKIEFLFTANAGQPLKPLNKVASGGEMSRFMLAVKNITADIDQVDTMIFDEIDTGISGDTANVLARKLAQIGKSHQVVCVTHLAQVASFGTNHFYISKAEDNGKTKTSLKLLDDESRVNEIARIIGGSISDFSISHARLMLEAGKNY